MGAGWANIWDTKGSKYHKCKAAPTLKWPSRAAVDDPGPAPSFRRRGRRVVGWGP
ncbi:hypothetical protein GCM10022226_24690 [Sphaerisporangium flaviroseum]|uniref:Uncharacterized protein n=1 Tax=Sphaerisporangium flaviroseum TaxID=509199 RepID=A0ABP7HXB9_9ACTN